MEKSGRVENLIPCSKRSKEEAKELGKKGGKASGMVRRERKRLQEALVAMLREKPKGSDRTRGEIILARVLTKLHDTGDMTDFEKLVKIIGYGEEEDKKGAPPVIVINEVVAKNGG